MEIALSLITLSVDSVFLQAKTSTGTTESIEGRGMKMAFNTGRLPDHSFPWPGLSLGPDRSPCIDSHKGLIVLKISRILLHIH